MSYSPSLTFFLDRLSGFSTNVFRLEPQSGESYTSGRLIRFTLPSNALLNMRTFAMHFNATVGGGTRGRLPAKIDSLIERVEVSAGGIQLSQGLNFYNVLRHAKDALTGNKGNAAQSHPEIIRETSYVNGATFVSGSETYTPKASEGLFCINHWEGFLGTCEPKILDTSLLPDLVVTIYLTTNQVLTDSKGTSMAGTDGFYTPADNSNAEYTLSGVHATIECIGLADAVYDNMVSSMISQKGFVEVPFKQYFSFSNAHTGSTRFTVATQSLDRIWLGWRESTFNSGIQAPHNVAGYLTGAETTAVFVRGTGGGITAPSEVYEVGRSVYGGRFDTNKERFVGPYYRFNEPKGSNDTAAWRPGKTHDGSVPTYQLQLNGAYYPQFSATAEEMYEISRNSVVGGQMLTNMSMEQYKDAFFVMCARFNMPDSEYSRTISGLDTRSVSMNAYLNTMNVEDAPNLVIFCECTSTLRIGSGRQIEVIT